MWNPIDILVYTLMGSVNAIDPTTKQDDIETHNSKWLEKFGVSTYLYEIENQPGSTYATYLDILTTILTGSEAEDRVVPYSEYDVAVLYRDEPDVLYFWLPNKGQRLKVYNDSGTIRFSQDYVKDFGSSDTLDSLTQEKDELESQNTELQEDVDTIKDYVYRNEKIYGFHIDSSESDPSACVTYLEDATNMTPAHMDFSNNTFIWGSWGNAFFLPKPCMLKYDGTVDYYLNPNDYSKKEDGTASDVSDFSYPGNAMMEWGQNGKKIWYKIVPDTDPTSASIYIASYQADADYRCWSFINNQGVEVEHFYTPIYNGSLDTDGRLRSISGVANTGLCQSKTASQEVTAAELNNPGEDKLWYTEVYSDITLINMLLLLMGKSLNTQAVFGNGVQGQASASTSMISTGTMNSKGLFWGDDDNTHGVKTFGMENWWGNQNRRFAGLVMNDHVTSYKMTRGKEDGSTATDYNTNGTGYLAGITCPNTTDYVKKMQFDANCFLPKEVTGTSSTYWCDRWYQNSGARYAMRGGSATTSAGAPGAFYVVLNNTASTTHWSFGAAPSCKPLPPVWRTIMGRVLSFSDGSLYPVKDLSAKIEPVQDLHGYDSPWAPGAGVNLINPTLPVTITSQTTIATYSTSDKGTWTATVKATNDAEIVGRVNIQFYLEGTLVLSSYSNIDVGATNVLASVTVGANTLEFDDIRVSISGASSGYSITVNEAQLNKGTPLDKIYPYSNICPITGWSSVNVNVTGKNLLNPNYSVYSRNTNYVFLNGVVPKGQMARFTFTDKDTSVDISGCYIGFQNGVSSSSLPLTYRWAINNGSVQSNTSNLSSSSVLCEGVFIYPNSEETFNKLFSRYNIMVELGSTATPYKPYVGTTYPVTLPAVGKNLLSNYPPTRSLYGLTCEYDSVLGCFTVSGKATTTVAITSIIGSGDTYIESVIRPNVQYVFSCGVTGVSIYTAKIEMYYEDGTFDTFDANTAFTLTKKSVRQKIKWYSSSAGAGVTFTTGETYDVKVSPQIELGSTPTAYEPYTNTVYSGEVDVTNGRLTLTSILFSRNTSTMDNSDNYPGWKNTGLKALGYTGDNFLSTNINVATRFGYNMNGANDTIYFVTSTWGGKVQSEVQALALDVQIVIPLITPLTFYLSETEIKTLLGDNTIWTDSGDTTVTYKINY